MSNRIEIEPPLPIDGMERLALFLWHYDLRIYVSDAAYFDVGAGSYGAFRQVSNIWHGPGFRGSMGSIGRWCEFAGSSEVMSRGGHDHDLPVNLSLPLLRLVGGMDPNLDLGMKPMQPLRIGNGVVISSGARVMTGVSVGDGAVIGANAVVTRDVEPLTIVAGVPAKPIRRREPFAPWWDFSVSYLVKHASDIQAVASRPGPHEWRVERPRFVLRKIGSNTDVLGFTDGEVVRPLSDAPQQVLSYVAQIVAENPVNPYWLADCWE